MNSPTVKAQSLPAWTQCKSKGDDEPFDLLKPFALVGNTILVSEFCSIQGGTGAWNLFLRQMRLVNGLVYPCAKHRW